LRAPSNRCREQRIAARLALSTREIPSTSGYPSQPSISDLITFAVHANRSCGGRSRELRDNGAGRIRAVPNTSVTAVIAGLPTQIGAALLMSMGVNHLARVTSNRRN
jgi:hypothetical protein